MDKKKKKLLAKMIYASFNALTAFASLAAAILSVIAAYLVLKAC